MAAETTTTEVRVRSRARHEPWLDRMVLPTLVVMAVVVGYPIVYTIALSVQNYNLLDFRPAAYVGAANYTKLAGDPIFWGSLTNTAVYTFGSVGVSALLGLALALLMENLGGARFRAIRALLLTPWAVPFVVVAFLFRYMYLQNGGVINAVLLSTGIIDAPIPWLNSSTLALPAVMVANIWAMAPFFFLLLSAALSAIPNEVIESARVDRAGTWGMIWHIKLPFLRNPLLISSLLMVISNFNDFAKIWAMTQGGPGYSTSTLVVYVYRLAFERFEFGYASAVGVIWLIMLMVLAWIYMRVLRMESR
ncbi:carbohydrate ABC transporter permease [Sinorhizobium mexicanum]|uniref:Sugar ABC transporter permease n=1 Tax=Sinorhizobium mexicanum TaxID=375549 RepID=A0A859QW65_9HYPH|nr:sugar ABC transporter permease [Sinorhizobium mexicanum]MBP1883982.1 ABC-type sugar transport system permease subunit [Sinorhizobium mexicanum]QLL64706.1 sugar ABC transporter permease [Sinorhizobium mexicanum]